MTTKDVIALIAKMLKPLNIRCLNLVRLGKVLLVKAGRTQSLQVQTPAAKRWKTPSLLSRTA